MFLFIVGLILFLSIPVVLIFALFKPAKFKIRTKKNSGGRWSWLQFFGFLAVTFIVSTVFLAIGVESDSVTKVAEENEAEQAELEAKKTTESDEVVEKAEVVSEELTVPVQQTKKEEPEPVVQVKKEEPKKPIAQAKTFGITLDEFGQTFMAQAKDLGLGDHAWGSSPTLDKGAVNDSFTFMLSDDLAMNGTVDKNGELKGITYIMGKTDEGQKAAMNMIIFGGLTAKALNPNLPQKQTSEVVGELMISAADKFAETGSATETKTVGNVKYTVVASKTMGLWLAFEPAK
jgi:hypothetical protein